MQGPSSDDRKPKVARDTDPPHNPVHGVKDGARLEGESFLRTSIAANDSVLKVLEIPGSFDPLSDEELSDLVHSMHRYMTEEELIGYIERVKKFDKRPVSVLESLPGESTIDFSRSHPVYWYHLRRDLELLPKYFDSADKLGLSQEEAITLLSALVESIKYDFKGEPNLIETQTKILERCAERSINFKDSVSEFIAFLRNSSEGGDVGRALGIAQLGIAAGMTLAQSLEIITHIYNGRGIAGYVFMGLYDELKALATNNVSGDLIFHSLKAVIDSGVPFSEFTQFLYVAATHTEHSQGAIFREIIQPAAISGIDQSLIPLDATSSDTPPQNVLDRASQALLPIPASGDSGVAVITKSPADYFPDISAKRLTHGILPYRATRNLVEGLDDLYALMKTEYQEGAWIFDQSSNTWYSLGGKTKISSGSIRHEFFHYDVAALSASPIFVHIHPEKTESWVSPDRNSLSYPQLQNKLTRFLAAMPSGSDLQTISDLMLRASQKVPLKGLIVTSSGLTEIITPDEPQSVLELSGRFRDLKDEVLLEFDAQSYLTQAGIHEPDIKFVKMLLEKFNKKLPPSFKVVVYPYHLADIQQ